MLRWMVVSSLKFRLLVVALAIGVVGLGVFQLGSAKAEALPEFSPVYIEVQTEALGLSATEVEELVTAPIEADLLNGVAFVDDIRSSSIPGLSSVVMIFEPGTTLPNARQLVQERLTQAGALPNVSKPPAMLEPVSSSRRVMMLGMSSPDLSLIDQSVLARWTVRPKLMGVPGVANVAVFGQRERQLQVQVDPRKLAERDVTMQQVISTTGNAMWVSPLTFLEASTPGTGGFIDTPQQRLGVRHVSPVVDAASLGQVAVEGKPGLRLGDVASVVEDHQPLIGDAVTKDTSGLMLVVEKFPDANTLEVTNGLEDALDDLAPGLGGVAFDPLYRPASYVESAFNNILLAAVLALALAALVIALFFRSWRTASIAVVVLPVSLLGAVAVLTLTGTPLNFLVVLGLAAAIAIVIDDAVAGNGDTLRTLRAQRSAQAPSVAEALVRTSVRLRAPLVFATLIAAVAVVPVFVLPGSFGALVAPMAIAYLVALVVALVVAVVLTAALSLLLLPKASTVPRESIVLRVLRNGYSRFAPKLVTLAVPALIASVVLVAGGAALLPVLGTSLAPTLQERNLLIEFDGAAATSQPEMSRIVAAATTELRGVPGVADAGGQVGRALLSDTVTDVNSGEIRVRLKEDADYEATTAAVESVVAGYPGLERRVSSYLNDRGADLLAQPSSDMVVRVYGDDPAALAIKAEEVRTALTRVDGLVQPTVQTRPQDPTIEITVDLAAAQRAGIRPGEVRRATATVVNGLGVGSIFEQQKVFDVVVRGELQTRNSVTAIQNMLIDLPQGGQVRLGDVAQVRVAQVPSVIERESVSRYVDVVGAVDGRGRGDVAADAAAAIRTVPFPFEFRAEVLEGYERGQSALTQVLGVAIAAAVVIFLLFQAAFRRWRLAVLAVLTLPVALSGGLVAAWIGGGVLTIGSFAGLVTILVLATRHMLTLVRHYQELEWDGAEFGPELVAQGTRHRIGPIATATVAAAAALLPVLVIGSGPGLELVAPMAAVVLGGLVTSALLNLLIVPALYLRFAGSNPRPADDDGDAVFPAERSDEYAQPARANV